VVDDEPEVRTLLTDFLSRQGYETRLAADGAVALCILAEDHSDVVLLDIDLPRLGGLQTLMAICAIAPHVKVIMISGKASEDLARQTLAHGAFDYLPKPIDLAFLTQRLETALLVKWATSV
jgi:DNA-binding response OmpR family regulator